MLACSRFNASTHRCMLHLYVNACMRKIPRIYPQVYASFICKCLHAQDWTHLPTCAHAKFHVSSYTGTFCRNNRLAALQSCTVCSAAELQEKCFYVYDYACIITLQRCSHARIIIQIKTLALQHCSHAVMKWFLPCSTARDDCFCTVIWDGALQGDCFCWNIIAYEDTQNFALSSEMARRCVHVYTNIKPTIYVWKM